MLMQAIIGYSRATHGLGLLFLYSVKNVIKYSACT